MASASDPSDPEIRYLPYTRNRGPCTLGFDGGVLSRSRVTPALAPVTRAYSPCRARHLAPPPLALVVPSVSGTMSDPTTWFPPVISWMPGVAPKV